MAKPVEEVFVRLESVHQAVCQMTVEEQIQPPFLDAVATLESVPANRHQEGGHQLPLRLVFNLSEVVPQHNSSQRDSQSCQPNSH